MKSSVRGLSSLSSCPRRDRAETAQYEKRESDSDQLSPRNEPRTGSWRDNTTASGVAVARSAGAVGRREGGRGEGLTSCNFRDIEDVEGVVGCEDLNCGECWVEVYVVAGVGCEAACEGRIPSANARCESWSYLHNGAQSMCWR